MARFFIDHPIFAWVIAIIIMLAGGLAIFSLPIARYPTIAPPTVTISATYPGASAQTLENSVTQIVEQNMKGLDGLQYMSATSESNGLATITLTFGQAVNPDIAQVQVQNKLQLATPLLPQVVQQQGVSVTKANPGFLMVLGFVSENGSMNRNDIADFVNAKLVDPISRVAGVGTVVVFGAKYAMRIWLDPNKLETYRLTTSDLIAAVRGQNAQVAVGQLAGAPATPGQQLNATVTAQDRLQTPEQFRAIVVRSNPDGSALTLGDVARVELGAENYDISSRYNGKPAAGVGISLSTGANALDTAVGVENAVKALKAGFPPGLTVVLPFDTTPFVRVSISGVVHTLLDAVVLVFLVMYLFLQNLRATLIPTIAVPVVLLGTFGVLSVLGLSINMLTMFAMVLAIGLLVDDAIVVVENVERLMSEENLSPREAARKSMDQITGALVGIGLVLSAVFVPMAFLGGATGVIYRQFSATIVSAMALSVLIAIVLTPALCATMLKPLGQHAPGQAVRRKGFFGWFNRNFERASGRYQGAVRSIVTRQKRFMLVFALMAGLMVVMFLRLPTGFLPEEDQGLIFCQVQTPVGATQERTSAVLERLERHFVDTEKDAVASAFTVSGFSFGGRGQNAGLGFISLKDWSERADKRLGVNAVVGRAMAAFSQFQDAVVFAFAPPAVPELGNSAGFVFYLKDNGGLGHAGLMQARNQFLGAAAGDKLLAAVRPNGLEDTPQFRIDTDVRKAASQGIPIADLNATLSNAWGGQYIDDFIDRGRVKRVMVQADAPFRMAPEDFRLWSVRNANGEMVPFTSFARAHWDYGSPRLERYNGTSALQINGQPAPGVSSGTAMDEVEKLVAQLPAGIGMEWTAQSFQERAAGAQTPMLYSLSLLIVFLCLAALYESWTIPSAVLMVVPLGILGTVVANGAMGLERDVYFQVAMLTTVGLSSKNAILIVEFAVANLGKGMPLLQATLHAVRDRLRPILMTSLAFGLGVLPLAVSTGAGSGAQRAIGTGVLGGMLFGTFLGIFFIPLFFMVVERLFGGGHPAPAAPATQPAPAESPAHG